MAMGELQCGVTKHHMLYASLAHSLGCVLVYPQNNFICGKYVIYMHIYDNIYAYIYLQFKGY